MSTAYTLQDLRKIVIDTEATLEAKLLALSLAYQMGKCDGMAEVRGPVTDAIATLREAGLVA